MLQYKICSLPWILPFPSLPPHPLLWPWAHQTPQCVCTCCYWVGRHLGPSHWQALITTFSLGWSWCGLPRWFSNFIVYFRTTWRARKNSLLGPNSAVSNSVSLRLRGHKLCISNKSEVTLILLVSVYDTLRTMELDHMNHEIPPEQYTLPHQSPVGGREL